MRPLSQIKLALRDNTQVSLSKRLAITPGKQKKLPKKPLFSDTRAAGPPLHGGKGFHSGWTNATKHPKIDVETQRAQIRQKKRLTWGTKGGNSFGNLAIKDAQGVKKNCLKPRYGYKFPRARINLLRHLWQHHWMLSEFLISYQCCVRLSRPRRNSFPWRFKWCRSLRRFRR